MKIGIVGLGLMGGSIAMKLRDTHEHPCLRPQCRGIAIRGFQPLDSPAPIKPRATSSRPSKSVICACIPKASSNSRNVINIWPNRTRSSSTSPASKEN
ncbi:MAG: hypothetical protein MZU97_21365 [Bacillus subtilis]|nr:hypothetical protein [Bacillus subtilis]